MVDGESDRDEALAVERVFEPSRIAQEALARAYEAAFPVPRAEPVTRLKRAPQMPRRGFGVRPGRRFAGMGV